MRAYTAICSSLLSANLLLLAPVVQQATHQGPLSAAPHNAKHAQQVLDEEPLAVSAGGMLDKVTKVALWPCAASSPEAICCRQMTCR